MIFKQVLVDQILAGEKTATRRRVKFEEPKDGPVARMAIPCRYKVGKTYAIQPGRGKKAVARLRVTAVRRSRWHFLSASDALEEGFPTIKDFFDYVEGLYPHLDPSSECWVIEFELVEPQPRQAAFSGSSKRGSDV